MQAGQTPISPGISVDSGSVDSGSGEDMSDDRHQFLGMYS